MKLILMILILNIGLPQVVCQGFTTFSSIEKICNYSQLTSNILEFNIKELTKCLDLQQLFLKKANRDKKTIARLKRQLIQARKK